MENELNKPKKNCTQRKNASYKCPIWNQYVFEISGIKKLKIKEMCKNDFK